MTEIDSLLRGAADRLGLTTDDDAACDLVRGRRALARRTHRTVAVAVASSALAATVAVTLATSPSDTREPGRALAGRPAVASASGSPAKAEPAMAAVALVSYRGTQPAGFTVESLPAHWYLQGVSDVALTIAPPDTTDPDPASYSDKLVVMLQSSDGDQTIPTGAGSVTVAGRPGHLDVDRTGYRTLTFDDAAGHVVVVQAAPNLHWDDDDLVGFAAGVHVTADAVQSHG